MSTPSEYDTLAEDASFDHDPPTYPHWIPPGPAPRNGLGIAALVLGVVGLLLSPSVVLGVVLGVLAVVLGLVARGRVRRGEATNGQMTMVGIVLGGVAIVVAIVAGVLLGPRLMAAVTSGGTTSAAQCVQNAHGDRAAVRQCRQQSGAASHGKHKGRGTPAAPSAPPTG